MPWEESIAMPPDGPAPNPTPAPRKLSRRQFQVLAAILAAAAAIYSYRIGRNALGASEAYSAWAASKPGLGAIIWTPILHDPGKQLLYYILLHYFTAVFGIGASALRAFSVVFALADVALVFMVGRELFDNETGVAAAAVWAFNPISVAFAHTARMYPLFIAIALAHFLILWRLRERAALPLAAAGGILGAAMPYTHIAGILIVGAETAMLVRDFARGRRNPMAWIAVLLTIALFIPYVPIVLGQSGDLLYGHSLDYVGAPRQLALAIKAAIAIAIGASVTWLVFGPAIERNRNEPIRWLAGWIGLPALAFGAGSLLIRPIFNLRYISPGLAALTVLIAGALALFNVKIRNLAAVGFATACLILLPFDVTQSQPWREFASQVATEHGGSEPVFFESGYVTRSGPNIANGGFPAGFYSVPFNYYFHGPNPRVAVPGYDPSAARLAIESQVSAAEGGWLVSWKDADVIKPELPDPDRFKVTEILRQRDLAIYRIVPAAKSP